MRIQKLEYTTRYGHFVAEKAIQDLYDALIELVTNCDDSYNNLGDAQGAIVIEVEHRHVGSKLCIRDKAQGMTNDEMEQKIKKVGDRTSGDQARGFMGRGLKDCHVLGNITVESIKDDCYYKCKITKHSEYCSFPRSRATKKRRRELDLLEGNGTLVTIELDSNTRMPRHEQLTERIPKLFSLEDILNEKNGRPVLLKNINARGVSPERLVAIKPPSEQVYFEEIKIPDYPEARCVLEIYKANVRLEQGLPRKFSRKGILIKGKKGIHERTFFSNDIETNQFSDFYYGKLTCEYIDQLCKDYDIRIDRQEEHPSSNPRFLLDSDRHFGLRRDHPFTIEIEKIVEDVMRELIRKDEDEARKKQGEIENAKTKKMFHDLSHLIGKFFDQEMDDPFAGPSPVPGNFEGIIPNRCVLAVDEEKTFGFRLKKREHFNLKQIAKVLCASPAIEILTKEFCMTESKKTIDFITGSFIVKGASEAAEVEVKVKYDEMEPFFLIVDVVQQKVDLPKLENPVEFEKQVYKVKEGKKRELVLRALYPEVVRDDFSPTISSDSGAVKIDQPPCVLKPVPGAGYAEGLVTIKGVQLGGSANILVQVGEHVASTKVEVVSTQGGFHPELKYIDEDFGAYRALWSPNEEEPKELHISILHESVKRYLGPKDASGAYPGQDSPHFKILLAEIISDCVCRYVLKKQMANFTGAIEIGDILNRYQKLIKDFSPLAHAVTLKDSELQKIFQDSSKALERQVSE